MVTYLRIILAVLAISSVTLAPAMAYEQIEYQYYGDP